MHVAGDAGALGGPRAFGVQPLIGLGALGPLAQREKKLTSGPDVLPHAVAASAHAPHAVATRTVDTASLRCA
jgi:hypothetical protein